MSSEGPQVMCSGAGMKTWVGKTPYPYSSSHCRLSPVVPFHISYWPPSGCDLELSHLIIHIQIITRFPHCLSVKFLNVAVMP